MKLKLIFKNVILTIMSKHKFNYAGIIYRHFNYIYNDVINFSKDKLSNNFYTNNTKFYWYLNDIHSFPKCKNKACNYHFIKHNVVITHGYPKFCSTSCSNLDHDVQEKMKLSYQNNFGYDSPFKCPKCINKRIKTYLKHYGCEHNMKSSKGYNEFKQAFLSSNSTITSRHYAYNNIIFDSSWELAYYIWLSDNNIAFEYQPNLNIKYFDTNNKQHTYLPDFYLTNTKQIIEIKGNQAFNKDGLPIYANKYPWFEKYDCMIKNNVTILKFKEIKPILNYVAKKYGKYYLKSFMLKSK